MAATPAAQDATKRKLLDPSELGTKAYWDSAYSRELDNYNEDIDDEGTVWFSESNAEEAVLTQLSRLEQKGLLRRGGGTADSVSHANVRPPAPSRFLDLGTGNGHLLFALREENEEGFCWSGEMIGVDYSDSSISLARRIATERQVDTNTMRFEQWDLLADPPQPDWLQDGFDVVLDKGTFDAISLMPYAEGSRHPCDIYREKVVPLIKPGHFLCITTCNWVKEELLDWLAPAGGQLRYYAEAKYPIFTFGGQTGQSIVTLTLRRVTAESE
ncbi:Protein-lysine N-methyltransferase efm4 [Friedmanniomyces endolithicus]|uniref:Protein-lysine N-methyltransferase EFM4 n=1 Tax=Friedmanniomyces endolithicus TaxID=329885 RepID=A0AAN6KFD6_9PEZI|nr:Protein-lysine N-methyltransferase efm4 [Friedmanniomyces endolithicus]KAK0788218.1 Protein-lysine N-methyltransferase efm4 [Friedmanniomyces endolithicus]KAK0801878.1 Protein-lysine N-methyltransferase efm4 [Friedmanniomyces endolithicus]KAK0817423.1 Protein-lysine N-methyltransferase efm4 [Friedmanniomyces endolithicus]KAK0847511.1 Protein-lysine N-methyltransferase efm4 [Friedmanniomyces endolithicus]